MKSTGTTDIWGKDDDSNINSDAINQALELSLNKDSEQFTRLSIAEAIHKLWKLDSGIKKCFDRSNEFQLEGSADYYFDNVFNFADTNYLSTDLDILKGRIKTTGITETDF